MKHSTEVPKAKSLQELGKMLAQLRYDAMIVVFVAFRTEIMRQMNDDEAKNRFMIAEKGMQLFNSITVCIVHLRKMLMIASPHMQEEIAKYPLVVKKDSL